MKTIIDAIFEKGAFRPIEPSAVDLPDGKHVRLVVEDETLPEALRLATKVYDGLSEDEIAAIERIALDRQQFFSPRDSD